MSKAKVLYLDIETMPMLASVWGLWENNVPLNMLQRDWSIIAFAAKWADDPVSKTIYMDVRGQKNLEDDTKLLKKLWQLLDECDIVIAHNGKKFDIKKIQARFLLNHMKPTSSFKVIDTLNIAKRHFALTSNKLEYLSNKLNKKYKKLKHNKFPGFELWAECLKDNVEAWKEMERYNRHDVLALQEVHEILQAWDNTAPNYNLYSDSDELSCNCGGKEFTKNGFDYQKVGKFQRWCCKACGKETKDGLNLLTKEQRAKLKRNTVR